MVLAGSLGNALSRVFSGDFHVSLALLAQFSKAHAGWVRTCFSNRADPYDAVWHNKLPFLEVGNGDFIASIPRRPVVYLSHDDGEGHGHILGTTFKDFVERHSRIGCVGAEDTQWLHFWSPSYLLDATCPAAVQWRQWFRLSA